MHLSSGRPPDVSAARVPYARGPNRKWRHSLHLPPYIRGETRKCVSLWVQKRDTVCRVYCCHWCYIYLVYIHRKGTGYSKTKYVLSGLQETVKTVFATS